MNHTLHKQWQAPLLEAVFIAAFILVLFTYWFGVANRHAVFLYDHVAVGIPRSEPFDAMTRSRYWVAGLVAAGAVLLLYPFTNWLLAQMAVRQGKQFQSSIWWHVWLLCAIPITIGIPAITMTVNSPTLPFSLATACVVATLLGLAVALLPGKWAVKQPVNLLWLAADAIGLMPALLLLRAVELPGRGLSVSYTIAWLFVIGGLIGGSLWLVVMTLLRNWRGQAMPSVTALLIAGLGLSYILLPLVHHLLATPPTYRYISTASNFFAFNPGLQVVALIVATLMAFGTTRLRRRFQHRN